MISNGFRTGFAGFSKAFRRPCEGGIGENAERTRSIRDLSERLWLEEERRAEETAVLGQVSLAVAAAAGIQIDSLPALAGAFINWGNA